MNVAVIGLGKLGYPLARVLAAVGGHDVYAVDSNDDLVERLHAGDESHVSEPGLATLSSRRPLIFHTPGTFELVDHRLDAYIILVPTPSGPDGRFSSRFVLDAADLIARHINRADGEFLTTPLVVVSSTVMPGTTAEVGERISAATGAKVDAVYSPEFVALGSVVEDMLNPDMILIGHDHEEERPGTRLKPEYDGGYTRARYLLGPVAEEAEFVSLSTREAEIAKLAVNAYVTMKISFANTLATAAHTVSTAENPVDALRIADAIGHDRRIGRSYLTPGAPFGGPCFERDQRAYRHVTRTPGPGFKGQLDQFVSVTNDDALQLILDHVARAVHVWTPDLSDAPTGMVLVGPPSVAVLGVGYRTDSPVLEAALGMKLLDQMTYTDVRAYDPHVSYDDFTRTVVRPVWWGDGTNGAFDADVIVLAMPWTTDHGDGHLIDRLLPPAAHRRYIDPWRLLPVGPFVDWIGAPHGV